MADYDLAFTGGTVVDGTGSPPFSGDVAIKDGRIVEIGKLAGSAARRVDITGLAIAPGVIDIHSHYDAEVCWDGRLEGSAEHGATTVIQGNCGIGVAPCRPKDREATIQDLMAIEGMSYDVLNAGIDWSFETFPEYLDFLRRRGLGINVAGFVPLSPLRRYVLGDEASERPSTAAETREIGKLLADAVSAGALGFSLTVAPRHIGYKGRPLACRVADRTELAAYANVLRDMGRGAIQVNPFDKLPNIKDEEIELVDLLLANSNRPVTYTGAHHRADDPAGIERMLEQMEPRRARGATVQSMIRPLTNSLSLRMPFIFGSIPAFAELLDEPLEKQMKAYADPAWRARAGGPASDPKSNTGTRWQSATVLRIGSEKMRPLLGKSVREIAAERGTSPFDTLIDVALEDNLDLRYSIELMNTDPAQLRKQVCDPRVLIGLSDGGAHVDQLCETGYPTYMLGHWVRREGALTLEHAIKRMTSEPADFFGLRDRGRVAVGGIADLMVFDPQTVDSVSRPTDVKYDLPGGGERLYAKATGMEHVVVAGTMLYDAGKPTGAMPGTIVADA
jgi:N-acyl-D-amino-acid deacylase